MDPWLSPFGAFDSAWFQFPKNSHLFHEVIQRFDASHKDKYIYISHEHKDHFDIEFLKAIQNRHFKIILANFRRSVVKDTLLAVNYQCEEIISLNEEEEYLFKDGLLRLYIVDAELDCDSAIVVKTKTSCFLNVNDCKIYDQIQGIAQQYGPINIFASQFSGAIWHPVCYDLPLKDYQRISNQKKDNKFSAVSSLIEQLNPLVYLPSAGPPCFLDPLLMHINFEETNIFPRAPHFLNYLDGHCKAANTSWPEIMPGDTLDAETGRFSYRVEPRYKDNDFAAYIKTYASEYADYFQKREQENKSVSPQQVFLDLRQDLEEKIKNMHVVKAKINTCLYWRIADYPEKMYRIDFREKTITTVNAIDDPEHFWYIEAPAWQVKKVLSNELNWPDFVLTFRVKLKRIPDVYNELIHGFIALDACEVSRFCELVEKFHANKERTIVECDGKRYSILRWCPHLGGDLSKGWVENGFWVCPRHHWHFDLANKGECLTSDETIAAKCLDD